MGGRVWLGVFAVMSFASCAGELGSSGTADDDPTSVPTSAGSSGSHASSVSTGAASTSTSSGTSGSSVGSASSAGSSSGSPGGAGGGGPIVVSSDAFASLQDAIDSLEATGGAVYVPAGIHLISKKVRVKSNITVFGAGRDATVLQFLDGVPKDHMMSNDSSKGQQNITIRDLTLLGPGADPGVNACCHGLKLENLTGGWVINVGVEGFGRDGIYLGYKLKGGLPKGVTGVRVSGCSLSHLGRNGLSLVHGTGNVIDGNVVAHVNTNELVGAIDLEPDDGLDVSNNLVVSNVVQNNANNGIQLYSAGGSYHLGSNAVCDNTLTGNAGTGVADNGDADVFVDNVFQSNGAEQSLDGSAKQGASYAGACGLPLASLPAAPAPPAP